MVHTSEYFASSDLYKLPLAGSGEGPDIFRSCNLDATFTLCPEYRDSERRQQ